MTSASVELPLDDGYLRRECPHCERQFKWHHGPTEDRRPEDAMDPPVYFCPYCGDTAPPDQWWTQEQLEIVEQVVGAEAQRAVNQEFKKLESRTRSGLISFKFKPGALATPDALHEPHDMLVLQPPCHPWEPIKVAEDSEAPYHCLLCGETFAV